MLRFTTVIIQEGKYFVARCVETGVVSQGKTIAEAEKNLKEAMELYVEDMPKNRLNSYRRRAAYVSSLDLEHA